MRVTVDERAVAQAAGRAGIGSEQAEALWADLLRTGARTGRARDVAWYGGGAISVAAAGVFLGTGWAGFGPAFGLAVALAYGVAALLVAEVLLARRYPVPAALMAVLALSLVPVLVLAADDLTGTWGSARFGEAPSLAAWAAQPWATVEVLVLVLGGLALLRYRASVLLAPVLLAGYAAVVEVGVALGASTVLETLVLVALLATGTALDRARQHERAFWVHLGALLALQPLLWDRWDLSEDGRALVCGLGGLAALAVGVRLERRLYLLAGALGVFGALSYLAFTVFAGSLLFPLALAALGIAVVVGGVKLDAYAR